MVADKIEPGEIEFCLPDRRTILIDSFVTVDESNRHLLQPGVQFITNQIRDAKNLLPILLTCKAVVGEIHIKSIEGLGAYAYDTCLIFKELNTTYKL